MLFFSLKIRFIFKDFFDFLLIIILLLYHWKIASRSNDDSKELKEKKENFDCKNFLKIFNRLTSLRLTVTTTKFNSNWFLIKRFTRNYLV